MKVLYVGCRVRILYSIHFPQLAGKEGVIVARNSGQKESQCDGDWIVSVDEWGSDVAPFPVYIPELNRTIHPVRFAPFTEQLEPILVPGIESEQEQESPVPEQEHVTS